VDHAPILVTGAPRSGTTWVGKMLACAPGVGYIHEPFSPLTDAGLAGRAFTHFLAYVTDANQHLYDKKLERCFRFSYDWRQQVGGVRSPRDVARTAVDGWSFARWSRTGARPLVKDPIAVFSAPWLAQRFGMDVVVTIRRPVAFVASFKRLGWRHDFGAMLADEQLMADRLHPFEADIRRHAELPTDTVGEAVLLWRMIYATVHEYRQEHPGWRFVRQEDLAREPIAQFEGLYGSLHLTFGPDARAAVESHSSSSNPDRLPRAHDTRLDSRASLEGWRSVLTPREVDQIREETADVAPLFYTEDEL
jgi:hypothetical protein